MKSVLCLSLVVACAAPVVPGPSRQADPSIELAGGVRPEFTLHVINASSGSDPAQALKTHFGATTRVLGSFAALYSESLAGSKESATDTTGSMDPTSSVLSDAGTMSPSGAADSGSGSSPDTDTGDWFGDDFWTDPNTSDQQSQDAGASDQDSQNGDRQNADGDDSDSESNGDDDDWWGDFDGSHKFLPAAVPVVVPLAKAVGDGVVVIVAIAINVFGSGSDVDVSTAPGPARIKVPSGYRPSGNEVVLDDLFTIIQAKLREAAGETPFMSRVRRMWVMPQGISVECAQRMCSESSTGAQLHITRLYHSVVACGPSDATQSSSFYKPNPSYMPGVTGSSQFIPITSCHEYIRRYYGGSGPLDCAQVQLTAARAARCAVGRQIGEGCVESTNAGHARAHSAAQQLLQDCQNIAPAGCDLSGRQYRESRYHLDELCGAP